MDRSEVNPMGYLAGNWVDANSEVPALVVNPEASPIDLLAWVGGELLSLESSCNALAELASGRESIIEFAEFEAVFVHRLAPIVRVLNVALCELIAQRRQADTSVATPADGRA